MRRRALVLLLPLAIPRRVAAATLDDVLLGLAAVRQSRATFSERRSIPELDGALPSSGTLTWQAPDRVEKHTIEPVEEHLVVAGDRLTIARNGVRQEVALDQAPELRALVEAIRGTLAGDRARLERHYTLDFATLPNGWRLSLLPRSVRVQAAVQSIVITGVGATIRRVETQERGGITTMLVDPAP